MKKIIALLLVISFMVAIPVDLMAKERWTMLRIIKKDGQTIMGDLIAVKAKQRSLLLIERSRATRVTVYMHDVKVIIIKSSLGFKGLLIGGVLGSIMGSIIGSEGGQNSLQSTVRGGTGALIGGGVGIGVGLFAGIDRRIKIEGKSEAEIEEILENLRKKVRIPDYN